MNTQELKPILSNRSHFEKCVKKYQTFFNLQNWEIIIHMQDSNSRASTYWGDLDDAGQIISICYSKHWIDDPETTLYEIEKTAFHEILEIMLCKLNHLARNTETTRSPREVIGEVHSIIRTMENKVLPLLIKFKI